MGLTSIIARVEINHDVISFGDVAAAISRAGGDISSIDVIRSEPRRSIRDITIEMADTKESVVVETLKRLDGIRLINVSDRTFLAHLGGKIAVQPKLPIKNRDDLSRVYTPGVARICKAIREDRSRVYSLTIKRNTVAVVTDGTAVLGLGNVGPEAAAPVNCRARRINEPMKLAAARAIASVISEHELSPYYIVPSIFNEEVVAQVRKAVIEAAILTGVAARIPPDFR